MTAGKKKLLIVVLFLGVVTIASVWIYIKFGPRSPVPPDVGVFSGFKVMTLPRSDVDLGSVWTQGVGPVKRPGVTPTVLTTSLRNDQWENQKTFKGSVIAQLMSALKLTANESATLKQALKLNGLSIVTVKDASTLSSTAGNSYIWEAVRVDKFSLTASKSEAEGVHAKVKDLAQTETISENATGTDSVEITADGSKLFVAYRIVTISDPTLSTFTTETVNDPTSDLNLGSEYSIHFSKSHPNETLFTPNCAVKLTISSFAVLTADSKPLQTIREEKCGAHESLSYQVRATAGSDRATIDILQISNILLSPREDPAANATGTFAIQRRTMKLLSLKDPDAPGW